MSSLVLINLAEDSTGVTTKVESILSEKDKKSKAAHDAKQPKGLAKLFKKTEVFQGISITRYELVETFDSNQAGFWFGLGIEKVMDMQKACSEAKKIYLCSHGASRDVDKVFATKGPVGSAKLETIGSVNDLGDFLEMLLKPGSAQPYYLTLIICFAARSADYGKVHSEEFLRDPAKLRDSLAYSLYKRLVGAKVNVRMTARLGEVRTDMTFTGKIVTQTEEGVLAGLQLGGASHDEEANRLTKQVDGKAEPDQMRMAELRAGLNAPKTDEERTWFAAYKKAQDLSKQKDGQMAKSGKLIYEMDGGQLVITLKYPTKVVLYRGVML